MTIDQVKGGMLGLAIGDALGVPVEFRDRTTLKRHPVVDMREFGSHHQPKGTWSDDSSLAFCLAESLIENPQIDTEDIGKRFCRWFKEGYLTPHGRVFDIGMATTFAIRRLLNGYPAIMAGGSDEDSNGNGSLMRILPLSFVLKNKNLTERFEITDCVSSITHAHVRSVIACFYYIEFALQLLEGKEKFEIYKALQPTILDFLEQRDIRESEIKLFKPILKENIWERKEENIRSSGYVVNTLHASIWCLMTSETYEETVLKAVNLGDDTDTTGAVAGGLAGILYGFNKIPTQWVHELVKSNEIVDLSNRFYHTIT